MTRFFFGPASGLPLALYRIAFGVLGVLYTLQLVRYFKDYYGHQGVLRPATVLALGSAGHPQILPAWLPDGALWLALAALAGASAALACGYRTRMAAIAVFVLLSSFYFRNVLVACGAERILRFCAFWLLFLPADLPLSVDRYLAVRRGDRVPTTIAPWPQRMIAIQIAVVYLTTFFTKTQGETWISGTAVYYAQHYVLASNKATALPLLDLTMVNIATYATLAAELALGTLVWFRGTRLPVLAGGIALHAGIAWNLGLWYFSAVMIGSYLCFLDRADLARLRRLARRALPRCLEKHHRHGGGGVEGLGPAGHRDGDGLVGQGQGVP
ncbi:MAG: HTTM domain-containing protein [Candidatus Sericytochromatia bacterium]|nr:HTTM domain-containing protein [Candidatus Tanganyikabacteria bacterium]